jgi:hypothetical protein
MTPFGYLFILAGAFLIRQTVVGRAKEIPTDARDSFTALLSADWSEFGSVLARRGENVSVESVTSSGTDSTGTLDPTATMGSILGGTYAGEVVKLGKAAKGYVIGGTGPTYYDCSGLLWKAAYKLGIYKGGRFTTRSFTGIARGWCTKVEGEPAIGDIVLWEGKHMGVCTGEDAMFSARSPSKGIGYSTISGDSSYFGSQPSYWRPGV